MVHRREENGEGNEENIRIKTKYLVCKAEKNWRRKELKIFWQEKIFGGKRNHTTKLSSLITLLKRLRKLIEKDC